MKKAIGWLVAVVVAVGVGFLGDHLARSYVENRAAEAVAKAVDTQGGVVVRLGGMPFSIALITRTVPVAGLDIASFKINIDDHQIRLAKLSATTGEVVLGSDTITAHQVRGTTRLGYADLGEIIGLPVSEAGGGRIKLTYSAQVFGRSVSVDVSARPVLDVASQVLRLSEPKLNMAGLELSASVSQDLIDRLVKPLELQVPYRLRLTSMVADADGVSVGFAGDLVAVPLR